MILTTALNDCLQTNMLTCNIANEIKCHAMIKLTLLKADMNKESVIKNDNCGSKYLFIGTPREVFFLIAESVCVRGRKKRGGASWTSIEMLSLV